MNAILTGNPTLSGSVTIGTSNTTTTTINGNFIVNHTAQFANNVILKYVSEESQLISITGTTVSITYGNASVIYGNARIAGPYTYNITGVPDLTNRSRIMTFLVQSNGFTNCFASTVNINSFTYNLLYSNGISGEAISSASGNSVITQQLSILPITNGWPASGGNVILTSLSYFK